MMELNTPRVVRFADGYREPTARDRLEAQIERLIDLLDRIDGDPDLEASAGYDFERDDSDTEPRGASILGGGYAI